MKTLEVALNDRTYKIKIGSSVFKREKMLFPLKSGNKVMLITNDVVSKIWKDDIFHYLDKFEIKKDFIILPDGEKTKNINFMEDIISELIKKFHGRDTTLIALGGGVIGDITGFVASVYQRGVPFIQIPTTLLSQVDAAIGGKTSINHPLGKNMIGSFWQPTSVIIDLDFLSTLPRSQLISGMAEVIKYAIIFDRDFFSWLENNVDFILELDVNTMLYCIQKCCKIKKLIVEQDEREYGSRALLNLGHTYGHAIETYLGYGTWLHGEAVAVGIIMAAETSFLLGMLDICDKYRIINLIKKIGLPTTGPKNMNFDTYYSYFLRDKKVFSEVIRLILPVSIGKSIIYPNVKKSILISAINNCS
ncbi:MAG: 3-dehydroquinate synthase [Buchnera aphidicola (Nurudea yanoniella)]